MEGLLFYDSLCKKDSGSFPQQGKGMVIEDR